MAHFFSEYCMKRRESPFSMKQSVLGMTWWRSDMGGYEIIFLSNFSLEENENTEQYHEDTENPVNSVRESIVERAKYREREEVSDENRHEK